MHSTREATAVSARRDDASFLKYPELQGYSDPAANARPQVPALLYFPNFGNPKRVKMCSKVLE